MDQSSPSSRSIEKKDAELLARHFNMSFGFALMYGVGHQMARDSIGPFFAALAKTLRVVPLITISVEHESVYIEGWSVDKIVNAKKLVAHFKKTGIQSFSFTTNLTPDQLTAFLEIATDSVHFGTIDSMHAALLSRGVNSIRINYVMYRRMTADEEVIRKGAVPSVPLAAFGAAAAAGGATAQPSDTVSITRVIADPRAVARALFGPTRDGKTPTAQAVAAAVARLDEQMRLESTPVASGELMEAILVLREECLNRSGAGGPDTDLVTHEVEKLTHDTVVHLLRQEYRAGELSVKRLAQILRRMLPDRRELRRLLPLLKEALLAEGMPFVKYVELVNELRHELEGDDVTAAIEAATREMGVSAEEVIDEIKKHPGDAARLIVLAAELRRTGSGEDAAFAQLLTDYIEQASRRLAVISTEAANPDNGRLLGAVLQKVEATLLENLKQAGVEQSILTALAARLTERLPFLLDITKTDWLQKAIDANPELDLAVLARVIAGTVQHAYDIDTHRDTISTLFQQKGLSPEQIQEVLQEATARVVAASQQIDLPKGVLSASAVMYFLDRECKLSQRYHNPFSLLIISILRLEEAPGKGRPLTSNERPIFVKSLIIKLKRLLRDIDMIGVPSSASEAIVFGILPMTQEAHTYGLAERLRRAFRDHVFDVGEKSGLAARLAVAVSVTGFDAAAMADKTVFLKVAMAHHRAAEKIRLSGISEKP